MSQPTAVLNVLHCSLARGFTPRANFGPEGSGVMDASRNGIVRGRYDADAELDPDYDSEIEGGEENEGGEQIRTASGGIKIIARHLDTIGAEHEMAPTVLPKDPTVEKAAHERRKERRERRIKAEAEKGERGAISNSDGSKLIPPPLLQSRWKTASRLLRWRLDISCLTSIRRKPRLSIRKKRLQSPTSSSR